MEEISRMQKNLLLIRRLAGWSAKEFGNRIGVTRQTINNIESGRSKLTKTQYIAMRYVLDAEMKESPDNTAILKDVLETIIDNPDEYNDEYLESFLLKANIIASAITLGMITKEAAMIEWDR